MTQVSHMKCLASVDNKELQSQLLHLSYPTSDRKCTDRIIGWKDNVGSDYSSEVNPSRASDVPKEKQIIRDFMQRNAPSLADKQYKFQHHLDHGDYILQYRLQHTLHITNSASLMYLSQFTSVASTGTTSALRNNGAEHFPDDSHPVIEPDIQPEIGSTYLNGVWTIAQKYHLAPPSLTQYTNWWKFNDQGRIEQDSKIPVFGKGITPSGRNMNVTKCTLKFPSETTNSAQSKRRGSDTKKVVKEEVEKLKDLGKLKNEDLRDASCKFFTAALEHRLTQLKQQQEDSERKDSIERPLSAASLAKRTLGDSAVKRNNDSEALAVTGKIPLFPPPVRPTPSGQKSSLPPVPHVNFMSVRECSDK